MRSGKIRDGHWNRRRFDNLLDALFAHQIIFGSTHVQDRKFTPGKVRGHVDPECDARTESQNINWYGSDCSSDLTNEKIGRVWADDIVPYDGGRR